jgi:hypothetical protein
MSVVRKITTIKGLKYKISSRVYKYSSVTSFRATRYLRDHVPFCLFSRQFVKTTFRYPPDDTFVAKGFFLGLQKRQRSHIPHYFLAAQLYTVSLSLDLSNTKRYYHEAFLHPLVGSAVLCARERSPSR